MIPIHSEPGSESSQTDDAAGELGQPEVEVGSYLVACSQPWAAPLRAILGVMP